MMPMGILWDELPIGGHFSSMTDRDMVLVSLPMKCIFNVSTNQGWGQCTLYLLSYPGCNRSETLVCDSILSINNPIIYLRTLYHVSFIIKFEKFRT